MPTSKRSTEKPLVQSTFLPEASPVSHSPRQEKERARQTIATSGRKCFELYGRVLRDGSSVKTLVESLLGAEAWYSKMYALTWKVRGTKSSRLLFLLRPSGRPTAATGSGSWPTPTASDYK